MRSHLPLSPPPNSLYRPPPQPPSIGRLPNLPLSAASPTSLYRPPPQPPSIGRLPASPTSLYRPPPQPPSIGRLLNLPLWHRILNCVVD
ncbi:hypothetical protein JTE90_013829 [Oedothorax gibbosus]|uniref:Uncharacterized protein n=1 Tax=Oedothorax gibbosus TaxID=931172 RepID=A0AAV6VLC3_9ARAC|nr:hypothetical protein JTE90_013829 [Oedothorax gibbosus]